MVVFLNWDSGWTNEYRYEVGRAGKNPVLLYCIPEFHLEALV